MNGSVLLDKMAVTEIVSRYMNYVDRGRWNDVVALFQDKVRVDYTSLRPQEDAAIHDTGTLVANWRERHEALTAYQHHLGTMIADIDGDRALCQASGIAAHYRPAPQGGMMLWQLGVAYDWTLERKDERWRIASVKAVKLWERTELFGA